MGATKGRFQHMFRETLWIFDVIYNGKIIFSKNFVFKSHIWHPSILSMQGGDTDYGPIANSKPIEISMQFTLKKYFKPRKI